MRKYYQLEFELPTGEKQCFIRSSKTQKYAGFCSYRNVPEWIVDRILPYFCLSPESAELLKEEYVSGGWFDAEGRHSFGEDDVKFEVLCAVVTDAPLYSGVLEHNTWEGESWFHAFPASYEANAKLKELEIAYDERKITCEKFVHDSGNIGRRPCKYTFLYNMPKLKSVIFKNVFENDYDLIGRRKRKQGVSCLYLPWFIEWTEGQQGALDAVQRAKDEINSKDQVVIYKGYPLRDRGEK
jgi:hypothetical protein